MARAPKKVNNPGHVVTDADTPTLPALVETANQVAAGDAVIMDSLETLKAVGRIEAFQFVATVADRVIAETYVKIKESKTYKGLPYRDAGGKVATVATLEEFCEAFMPKSRRRCEELANNLHLLGPELYEQSEAMGLRQRDYNAIKALPGDQQEIIKQAVAAKDKDTVIELLQDMAVKFDKEKTALTKANADIKGDNEALDRLLKEKSDRLLAAEKRIEFQKFPDVVQDVRVEVVGITGKMLELLNRMDQLRDHILQVDLESFKDEEAATAPMAQIYYTGLLNLDIAMRNLMADADDVFSGYVLHEQAEGRPGANPVISSEFHAWVTENFNREKAIAATLFGKDAATGAGE